jgi:hypothetical protein
MPIILTPGSKKAITPIIAEKAEWLISNGLATWMVAQVGERLKWASMPLTDRWQAFHRAASPAAVEAAMCKYLGPGREPQPYDAHGEAEPPSQQETEPPVSPTSEIKTFVDSLTDESFHEQVSCCICDAVFSDPRSLELHFHKKHGASADELKPLANLRRNHSKAKHYARKDCTLSAVEIAHVSVDPNGGGSSVFCNRCKKAVLKINIPRHFLETHCHKVDLLQASILKKWKSVSDGITLRNLKDMSKQPLETYTRFERGCKEYKVATMSAKGDALIVALDNVAKQLSSRSVPAPALQQSMDVLAGNLPLQAPHAPSPSPELMPGIVVTQAALDYRKPTDEALAANNERRRFTWPCRKTWDVAPKQTQGLNTNKMGRGVNTNETPQHK